MAYKFVVGIDLGTTNTLACYMKNGKPELVKFPGSGQMLPSVIYTNDDQSIIVGKKAVNKGIIDPSNVIRSSKTYIGKHELNKTWTCNGKTYTPTDVATEILKEVKRAVVKTLSKKFGYQDGDEIGAVITVPAYFNSNQTDETKRAGEAAGFKIIQIITEPMAAAVTVVRELGTDEKVFVLDLGGGTFDMSVLEANQANHVYEAIAVGGDPRLGGDDFDEAIKNYFVHIIEDDTGIDLSSNETAKMEHNKYLTMMNSILMAARSAKEDLSDNAETTVEIANLFNLSNGKNYDLEIALTVDELNDICKPIFDKIESKMRDFVTDNVNFRAEDLGELILAGGSCHIPRVKEIVQNVFQRPPRKLLDPATLVVYGACSVAEANNGGLNITINDILSRSFGVAVWEDGKWVLSKILTKGTHYPCAFTKPYTTTNDNQREIVLNVFEAGDGKENVADIKEHDFYGQMTLTDIEIARAGVPNINVTFQFDKDRCLNVTAIDTKIGKTVQNTFDKKAAGNLDLSAEKPIDFALLLDSSGSMIGQEMAEAKQACNNLFDEMIDFKIHRMALISFADSATKQCGLTHDAAELKNNVEKIHAAGMTDMLKPLKEAWDELKNSPNERVIIMVTDGIPTENGAQALDFAQKLRVNHNVKLVVIGAGNGINMNYLTDLAGSAEDVNKIDNMSALKKVFEKEISRIREKINRNR